MFIELHAYQTHVFLDFREMADDADARLERLAAHLHGRGVASMERAGLELSLQPLHGAWRELCRSDLLRRQLDIFHGRPGSKQEGTLWLELEEKIIALLAQAGGDARAAGGAPRASETLLDDLLAMRALFRPERGRPPKRTNDAPTAKQFLQRLFREKAELERLFLLWLYARRLVEAGSGGRPDDRMMFGRWLLDGVLAESLRGWGFAESRIEPARLMIRSACGLRARVQAFSATLATAGESVPAASGRLVERMVQDEDVQALLQLHRYRDDLFFNRESFLWFCEWLTVLILWESHRLAKPEPGPGRLPTAEVVDFMNYLPSLAEKAEYRLPLFLEKLAGLEKK
jgi:hypothetical protein